MQMKHVVPANEEYPPLLLIESTRKGRCIEMLVSEQKLSNLHCVM